MLHFWKGCSMSIILRVLCRNIDFSKRGTALLKGGLDIWTCTLHSFKGHGATFQGILHLLFGYCPCKNTRLNGKFISVISFDEGFCLCSYVTNYVLCCLRMWRTSFVLSSTIFTMFFSHTFDGHLVSMRFWLRGMCQLTLRWRYSPSHHLEMSKKAHAHSPELSIFFGSTTFWKFIHPPMFDSSVASSLSLMLKNQPQIIQVIGPF